MQYSSSSTTVFITNVLAPLSYDLNIYWKFLIAIALVYKSRYKTFYCKWSTSTLLAFKFGDHK